MIDQNNKSDRKGRVIIGKEKTHTFTHVYTCTHIHTPWAISDYILGCASQSTVCIKK